jgi:uncharacterized damage-inducible protein DinB
MLQDLMLHKRHANAVLFQAIRDNETAADDPELRKTLHHILVANRFWLSLMLGLPFVVEEESKVLESLADLETLYKETHARELEWASKLDEADLARTVETPYIPGHSYSLAQALMQVCMHSAAHRAQCSKRLRQLGGTPPGMDFIVWLKERPAAW